jgi:branched-chain amino acid transport system substrate-binding protein
MASYNDHPSEKDDIYKILAQVPPQEVEDKEAAGACKLEPLAATPSYEQ